MHPVLNDSIQELYANRATLPHVPVDGVRWADTGEPVMAYPVLWQLEPGYYVLADSIDARIEDGVLKGGQLLDEDKVLERLAELDGAELEGWPTEAPTLRVVH